MSEGRLHYEAADGVARVTFDNPKAHNALTMEMWRELGEVCGRIARDSSVRVAVFRGAGGKSFISGTDIGGFLKFENGQQGVEYERLMDQYVGAVEALPQPSIAVIDGWAVGGGLAIACACDFRVATPAARFGSPIALTIGNCLSMRSYARLVSHVGIPQAKRLMILGDILKADELMAIGMLTDLVEPEALGAAVDALCLRLMAAAPLTVKASKEAIRRLTYRNMPDLDDMIAEVYGSGDFKMGVRNFMAKQPRNWSGS